MTLRKREKNPIIFICFVSVVLYGGEVPSVADLLISTANAAPMQQEDEPPPPRQEDEALEEHNHQKKKKRDSMASWIERLGYGDLLSYSSEEEFDSKVERAMREFEAM